MFCPHTLAQNIQKLGAMTAMFVEHENEELSFIVAM
jgi:hypothetical protein